VFVNHIDRTELALTPAVTAIITSRPPACCIRVVRAPIIMTSG